MKKIITYADAAKPYDKAHRCGISAGAYCRLSVRDQNGSMETQLRLVEDFIREHEDLYLSDSYIDDGYSGIGFDRPELNRLLSDIRAGKIQCVVVKDLSRFGRDYLTTGYYIEKIFPRLNIRFIAITDDFDSARQDSVTELEVPLKNIVNAAYAKDISRKLRAMYAVKRERGERMSTAAPPYGYRFSDKAKTRLAIDDKAAKYVRMMFLWARLGVPVGEIKKRLNLIGAPTPRQMQAANGIGTGTFKDASWENTDIGKMLSNREYAGDTVTGVTSTNLRKRTRTPEESWVVTPDTHEPVIGREEFDMVQEILAARKEKKAQNPGDAAKNPGGAAGNAGGAAKNPDGEAWILGEATGNSCGAARRRAGGGDVFCGMLYCGICGRALRHERRPDRNRANTGDGCQNDLGGFYYCGSHVLSHRVERAVISACELAAVVTDKAREALRQMREKRDILIRSQETGYGSDLKNECALLDAKIADIFSRMKNLTANYAGGIIDGVEYASLKDHYAGKINRLKLERKRAASKLRAFQHDAGRFIRVAADLENKYGRYLENHENPTFPPLFPPPFYRELVKDLANRIELFEDGRVEIHLKHADEFARIADLEREIREAANE